MISNRQSGICSVCGILANFFLHTFAKTNLSPMRMKKIFFKSKQEAVDSSWIQPPPVRYSNSSTQIHQGWHFHYFQQGPDLCLTFFPVFRSNCVLLRAKLLFSGRIIGLRLLVLDQSSTYYYYSLIHRDLNNIEFYIVKNMGKGFIELCTIYWVISNIEIEISISPCCLPSNRHLWHHLMRSLTTRPSTYLYSSAIRSSLLSLETKSQLWKV